MVELSTSVSLAASRETSWSMFIAGSGVPTTLSDHYWLDLSRNFSTDEAQSKWKRLATTGNYQLEPNAYFSMNALESTNSYIIHGGIGYNNDVPLINQTIVYYADVDRWETLGSSGVNQV
ncbi:hypothetical protein EC973_002663 [Apophysomyces ossiformis]|uniref:Galactose oxidase n=1 Tax=Apophysomyces ossiformis TaxID=679940 RepID=A0A8H7BI14_9FUNG|nr:hypothetical protein EC973_002663 [Apophysomyces ossiformis]